MFVNQWMSAPAIALPDDTRAVDALELMVVKKIRRIPVLKNGRLAGILTQSDLQAVLGPQENSTRRVHTRLGDIMTPRVHTVAPDAPLERAARRMLQYEVSGLPVVEGTEVVGMITESDIFRAFTRVMGIWEIGGRVVMQVPRGADLIEEIRSRTGGASIHSLAAYRAAGGGWEVVARLQEAHLTPSRSPD